MTANDQTGIGKYVCYISYLISRDFPVLASSEVPLSSAFFCLTINIHIKKTFWIVLTLFWQDGYFFSNLGLAAFHEVYLYTFSRDFLL